MPKIHEREKLVREADLKICQAIAEATKDLTTGETLRVINSACSSYIGSIAKHEIRAERHPDNPDKPGGIA